jgi:adenine-specific DNA-methyltransferase
MPTLDWLNRAEALTSSDKVPYRVLEPVSEHSSPRPLAGEEPGERGGEGAPHHDNLLIQGDNLDALKALLPFYRGRVKCIFIDPPYNTKSAFEHYDDNLEHSQWLSMMYPRLVLLRELLAEDGSIWVTIDDNEGHYLKVLMDEVFGRRSYVATCVWQKRYSRENREAIGDVHDYIHVYATSPDVFKKRRNLIPLTEEQAKVYRNPNNDPKGRWRPVPMTAQEGHATPDQFYEVVTPTGVVHRPPAGRCWGIAKATYERLLAEGRIYFGKSGDAQPNIIRYLSEVPGIAPWTWWPSEEVGHTDESKKEVMVLFGDNNPFDTPKPERLIQRILHIATNAGDLVLDSFLGSSTTAAVAHKMGRCWIGIEMGEHAETHCLPRLQKVIEGEQGGISQAVNWQGGGGFRFLRLGEPMFHADGSIHPAVRFATLASFVWMQETGLAASGPWNVPKLGEREGRAIYLLFNGILGDKRPQSGNVLTQEVLAAIKQICPFEGEKIIYGEACRLGEKRLAAEGITFKHIPYDVKAR